MCHGNVTLHPQYLRSPQRAPLHPSEQAGDGVDEKRENDRVESEAKHAVHERETPHSA